MAVLGGTGKTGRSVVRALSARGAEAVPLGRAAWANLPGSLSGCEAAYVIAPNMHPDEPAYVAAALGAAEEAGVRRVVLHSVAAPYSPAMPHHLAKAEAEDVLRRSGVAWTILQPCAYVQNLVPPLVAGGPLRVPYDVDAPFGLVDLADVAEAAATVLLDAGHTGATYELGGPVAVSVGDVGAVASELLGRPVPVERVDPSEWARTEGAGLDDRVRHWLLAMFAYYDAYGLPTGPLPLSALLGRSATSLGDTLRRELT